MEINGKSATYGVDITKFGVEYNHKILNVATSKTWTESDY